MRPSPVRPATSSSAQPLSRADQLERLSADLDLLIRDERLGTRSHRQVDQHCDRAEAIAAGVRAVYRGAAPPPVNPPLRVSDNWAAW